MTAMHRALFVAAVCAIQPACGRAGAVWPPGPADVRLGEDACAHCRMIVSDGRFAAQAIRRDQAALAFDDAGCLAAEAAKSPFEPEAAFVRAFDGDSWVRASDGWAVRSRDISSPMGFGVAAFTAREAATAFAAGRPGAVVFPLSDIARAALSRAR